MDVNSRRQGWDAAGGWCLPVIWQYRWQFTFITWQLLVQVNSCVIWHVDIVKYIQIFFPDYYAFILLF